MFDNYHCKELEPLGQEVLPVEPPTQQPSPSPENAKFSASEPEWQCQAAGAMGKDFFAKPVHCRIAALERGEIDLQSLFPSEEGNPNAVTTPPAETDGTDGSGGEEGMPVNPTPTNKPTAQGGSYSIPPSQMPSADGCTYDDDGNPNCVVTWQGEESNPIANISAEFGGDDDSPKIQTKAIEYRSYATKEAANLIATLAEDYLNKNKSCEDFLNQMINILSVNKNKPPLAGSIRGVIADFRRNSKGAVLFDDSFEVSAGSGEMWHTILINYPNLRRPLKSINPKTLATKSVGSYSDFWENWTAAGAVAVHEFLHWAGKRSDGGSFYKDEDFVTAARSLGFKQTVEDVMKANPDFSKLQAERMLSRNAIEQFCSLLGN